MEVSPLLVKRTVEEYCEGVRREGVHQISLVGEAGWLHWYDCGFNAGTGISTIIMQIQLLRTSIDMNLKD